MKNIRLYNQPFTINSINSYDFTKGDYEEELTRLGYIPINLVTGTRDEAVQNKITIDNFGKEIITVRGIAATDNISNNGYNFIVYEWIGNLGTINNKLYYDLLSKKMNVEGNEYYQFILNPLLTYGKTFIDSALDKQVMIQSKHIKEWDIINQSSDTVTIEPNAEFLRSNAYQIQEYDGKGSLTEKFISNFDNFIQKPKLGDLYEDNYHYAVISDRPIYKAFKTFKTFNHEDSYKLYSDRAIIPTEDFGDYNLEWKTINKGLSLRNYTNDDLAVYFEGHKNAFHNKMYRDNVLPLTLNSQQNINLNYFTGHTAHALTSNVFDKETLKFNPYLFTVPINISNLTWDNEDFNTFNQSSDNVRFVDNDQKIIVEGFEKMNSYNSIVVPIVEPKMEIKGESPYLTQNSQALDTEGNVRYIIDSPIPLIPTTSKITSNLLNGFYRFASEVDTDVAEFSFNPMNDIPDNPDPDKLIIPLLKLQTAFFGFTAKTGFTHSVLIKDIKETDLNKRFVSTAAGSRTQYWNSRSPEFFNEIYSLHEGQTISISLKDILPDVFPKELTISKNNLFEVNTNLKLKNWQNDNYKLSISFPAADDVWFLPILEINRDAKINFVLHLGDVEATIIAWVSDSETNFFDSYENAFIFKLNSLISNQGSQWDTFRTQNAATIAETKRRNERQSVLNKITGGLSVVGGFAGVASSLLKAGTSAGAVGSAFAVFNGVKQIATADNEKKQYNASLIDISQQNPNSTPGSLQADFASRGTPNYPHKSQVLLEKPVEAVLINKTIQYEKFGYICNNYEILTLDHFRSHYIYNHLQISQLEGYIGIQLGDIALTNTLSERLSSGIRIWHNKVDEINYNQHNPQKDIGELAII